MIPAQNESGDDLEHIGSTVETDGVNEEVTSTQSMANDGGDNATSLFTEEEGYISP
jgi:hypothetical protein